MAVLFPFDPDWSTPVRMVREYLTEIVEARDFSEVRKALRLEPRRVLSFTAVASPRKNQEMFDFLWRYAEADFYMPDWTRPAYTSAPLLATEDAIQFVGGKPDWLVDGLQIMLQNGASRWQAQVFETDAGSASLTSASALDWPAGTRVYPLMYGRLNQRTQINRETLEVGLFDVEFREDPNSGYAEPELNPDLTVHNRFYVWDLTPNWRNTVGTDLSGYLETISFEGGPFVHQHRRDPNRLVLDYTYLVRGQAQAEEFIRFYHNVKGRRGQFWLPTFREDLVLAQNISASRSLRVVGGRPRNYYQGDQVHKHFMIQFHDGRPPHFNAVSGMTATGGDTTISTDVNLPVGVTPAEVSMICWLLPVRMGTDKLTLNWITDHLAECSITFATLTADGMGADDDLSGAGGGIFSPPGPAPFGPIPPPENGLRVSTTWAATVEGQGGDPALAGAQLRIDFQCFNGAGTLIGTVSMFGTPGVGDVSLNASTNLPLATRSVTPNYIVVRTFPLFSTITADQRGPLLFQTW